MPSDHSWVHQRAAQRSARKDCGPELGKCGKEKPFCDINFRCTEGTDVINPNTNNDEYNYKKTTRKYYTRKIYLQFVVWIAICIGLFLVNYKILMSRAN
jgi:hypothetical protein